MPSMGKMFICVWRWCVGAYMYGRHWREFLFSSRFVFVARINGKELPYVFAGNTHTLCEHVTLKNSLNWNAFSITVD